MWVIVHSRFYIHVLYKSTLYKWSSNNYACVYFKQYSQCVDPYVKIYLMCEGRRLAKWKTTIRKNTLVPIFNERFQFHVPPVDLSTIVLELRVMDYDRFTPNDLMGVVLIGEGVPQDSGREHWAEMVSSVNQAVSNWHPILPETALKYI